MLKFFAFLQDSLADRRVSGDRGAAAVEYALLVFLISIAILFSVIFLSVRIAGWFLRIRIGL